MSRELEPGGRPVQGIFHYAILLAVLASRSATSTRAGHRPARELDSEMKFGRALVCDLLAS